MAGWGLREGLRDWLADRGVMQGWPVRMEAAKGAARWKQGRAEEGGWAAGLCRLWVGASLRRHALPRNPRPVGVQSGLHAWWRRRQPGPHERQGQGQGREQQQQHHAEQHTQQQQQQHHHQQWTDEQAAAAAQGPAQRPWLPPDRAHQPVLAGAAGTAVSLGLPHWLACPPSPGFGWGPQRAASTADATCLRGPKHLRKPRLQHSPRRPHLSPPATHAGGSGAVAAGRGSAGHAPAAARPALAGCWPGCCGAVCAGRRSGGGAAATAGAGRGVARGAGGGTR